MQTFTDLVGAAVVPAHTFDTDELTDLAPALETPAVFGDMGPEASEAAHTFICASAANTYCLGCT